MKSSAPLLLADLTTCCKYAVFVAALSTVELWTVCPSFFSLGIRALTTARLISLSRNPLYSAPYPAPVAVCPALILILMVHTSSLAYLAINETLVLSHREVFHCIPSWLGFLNKYTKTINIFWLLCQYNIFQNSGIIIITKF